MKILYIFLAALAVGSGSILKSGNKIVGGHLVNIADYPYQVSVHYEGFHVCGGTIIDEFTVVTAAHCVYEKDHNLYSIRVGSNENALGDSYLVTKIIPHEEFATTSPGRLNNDVAILKLGARLHFSNKVQPIELQKVEVQAGTIAWVSGWGSTQEGSPITPDLLSAVDVKVISHEECIGIYEAYKITNNMLCAYALNHDSCDGDSGGPLVADGRLIGIVSWGRGCARPTYPGVYAKVSSLHDWIEANK